MMKTAEKVLVYLKNLLEFNLDELYDCGKTNEFIYGEKTAYVECLEIVQQWECAEDIGLDYEVEKKYPL